MKIIDKAYIDGKFIPLEGNNKMNIINPSTEEIIGELVLGNEVDAKKAIHSARAAFKSFSQTSVAERKIFLQNLHNSIISRIDDLNKVCIEEYGATAKAAEFRNKITAESFLIAKEVLDNFNFEQTIGKAVVRYEPLGVAAVITPWNANNSQIAIKVAAAISAGCTVVIKPSEYSALQAQIIAECFDTANLPHGVINFVNGLGNDVGNELSTNPDVAIISFTGSLQTAKIIQRNSIDTMKRLILELGGKSANIILDDANFDKAIPHAVMSCFGNHGQMCIAASRLFVPEKRLDEVKSRVREVVSKIKVGSPFDEDTFIGPLMNKNQFERIQNYIQIGIDEGAELVIGGLGRPDGLSRGYFVKPTVFANVKNNMRIAQEEIFGPVLSILTYRNEDEAVELANNTKYGLGAYISTSNIERANDIARKLVAGTVYINGGGLEMRAPYGGFKQSGIGRECGIFGMLEYMEPKTIL